MTIMKKKGYKRTSPRIINGQHINGWLKDSFEDANKVFGFLCNQIAQTHDIKKAIIETKKEYKGVLITFKYPESKNEQSTIEITVG